MTATINDGSGYVLNATGGSGAVYNTKGTLIAPPINAYAGAGTLTDRNGNIISIDNSGNITDTLGTVALTVAGSGTTISPITFSYTAPSGATAKYQLNYTNYTVATNFGVSGIAEYKSPAAVPLVSSIALPDGSQYTFTYEATPGTCTPYSGTTCVTARVHVVTLPTGGTITYVYSGGNSGILSDGSTATLTRTTPDGTWSYAQVKNSGAASTTTITDPQGDVSKIQFQGIYETQRTVTLASGTQTTNTCYNTQAPPAPTCTGTAVTLPITKRYVGTQLAGGNLTDLHYQTFDTYGNLAEQDDYDYGAGANGGLLKKTAITPASLGNNITAFPEQVTVTNGSGTTVSQTNYNYDQGSVQGTTGTPQHTSISGSRGNLTSVNYYTQGSTYLTASYTYFDTGNVQAATDVNGAQTSYTYGACGNSFPTTVNEPLSLSRTYTWDTNCAGAVVTSVKDENGQTATSTYNDAWYWRPYGTTDQAGYQTTYYYQPSTQYCCPWEVSSNLTFNNGASEVTDIKYMDGLGRTFVDQRYNPGTGQLDSTSFTFDSNGRLYSASMPCEAGWANSCPTGTPATTYTYDALNRPLRATDGGGGTATYTYAQNDVLVSVTPAPSGENAKQRQFEYDALRRLTSVCEITSAAGSGTCGQTNAKTGYWTKYTYSPLGEITGVTQNAQSSNTQTRTYVYDLMGRLTSETNPESGTTTYAFDTTTGTTCQLNSPGDLLKKVDANGNWTCYNHDLLHRLTDVGNSNQSAANPCRRFRYDNAPGLPGSTKPAGIVNTMGRLAEVETDFGNLITDEWFSYTPRGEASDFWESTPHSGAYYHTTASYWANGALNQLTAPGLPTITYGLDGEGRPKTVSASSGQNPVTNTTYNTASLVTGVTLGSGDGDTFAYDPNTNRMTQYQFDINGQFASGNLVWNSNGTLGSLGIIDAFNNSDTQNCNYAHDDLVRVASVNCGGSLVQNPGFESGNVGWNLGGGWSTVNNSSIAEAGNWYLSGSATAETSAEATLNGTVWQPVSPGEVMTYGGWVQRVSGTGDISWGCEVADSNHNLAAWCSPAGTFDTSGGTTWQFYQQQITIPANGAYIRFYAEIHCCGDGDTSLTTGYFDSAFLEGAPVWSQTFSYDSFGNISKTGSIAFQANYSTANRITSIAGYSTPTYDADGNLLTDTFNTYTWNAYGNLASVNGTSLTYDAFGRMVEISSGPAQFIYSPTGGPLLAQTLGQTLNYANVPLPGGLIAVYNSSGLYQYNHPDWLGSARLFSTPNRSTYPGLAYAPFGEGYAGSGGAWIQFTSAGNVWTQNDGGNNGTGTLDDFMYRRYNPSSGRWTSPDPAGLAAVDPTNPQSWNRYAYVGNSPLTRVDPKGLHYYDCVWSGGCSGSGSGAGVGAGDYGGGTGGCSLDGVQSACGNLTGLGSDGIAPCPGNACSGFGTDPYTGQPAFLQFTAGAGGATGYLSLYDWTQGVNEVNGNFLSDTQYFAYLQTTYAAQISAQCGTVSGDLSADFAGSGAAVSSCNPNYIQGSHANFSITCGAANGGDCAGRWAGGLHIETDGQGNYWAHNDTASYYIGSSFNWATFNPWNLFVHGTVDFIGGTFFNYLFSH